MNAPFFQRILGDLKAPSTATNQVALVLALLEMITIEQQHPTKLMTVFKIVLLSNKAQQKYSKGQANQIKYLIRQL